MDYGDMTLDELIAYLKRYSAHHEVRCWRIVGGGLVRDMHMIDLKGWREHPEERAR